jgi:hypothetical protein
LKKEFEGHEMLKRVASRKGAGGSRMTVGSIDGHSFGRSGVVEGLVSRGQGHRGDAEILVLLADLECGGPLHGVRGAQSVSVGQPHGVVMVGRFPEAPNPVINTKGEAFRRHRTMSNGREAALVDEPGGQLQGCANWFVT